MYSKDKREYIRKTNINNMRNKTERKWAIITIAGSSTRFSESVGKSAHKSLEIVPSLNMSLLEWQITTLIDSGIEEVVVVTGFMKEKAEEIVSNMNEDYKKFVHFIYNENYSTFGSFESMLKGFEKVYDLIQNGYTQPSTILCVEGDLYCSNLAKLVKAPFNNTSKMRPTCNGKSLVDSTKDVCGIIYNAPSSPGFCKRIQFAYSTNHKSIDLSNIERILSIFPSGQMWEVNVQDIYWKGFFEQMSNKDKHSTNLSLLEYFSYKPMAPFILENWVNANTIKDFDNI